MALIETRNPATGKLIKTYEEMPEDQINQIISDVHHEFQAWQHFDFKKRATLMHKAAEILRHHAKDYAELMMIEMGKPFKSGVNEVEKCAWGCDFFAENAENFLASESVSLNGATRSFITFQPLGAILAIMPWNFPFWQVFRFAAPSLMAGNVGLLKHSPNTTGCALAIEEIFHQAGFPKNAFRTLITSNEDIDKTIPNKKIAAVTLTGSTRAGKTVGQIAGSCVKKVVLELGEAILILF